MKNVLDKSCRENQNTHFVYSNFPPPPQSCLILDTAEKHDGARGAINDVTIWRISIAC
jgi:hypothetical protein